MRVSSPRGGFSEILLVPVEAVWEQMARVSLPREGFGAKLSSSAKFFGSGRG